MKFAMGPFPKKHTRLIILIKEFAGFKNGRGYFSFDKTTFSISFYFYTFFKNTILKNWRFFQNFDLFFKNLIYIILLKHI